jgi:hypothetical protein
VNDCEPGVLTRPDSGCRPTDGRWSTDSQQGQPQSFGYSIIGHAAITTSGPVSIARGPYADPKLTQRRQDSSIWFACASCG